MLNNKFWSEKILKKIDPGFKHRWELFENYLQEELKKRKVWIDCGCGDNRLIEFYKKFANKAVGVDLLNMKNKNNYIKADIKKLPFHSDCVDLVTLRFVVEHFENKNIYISELSRILKKEGHILIITTNLLCPLIFLPKITLPSKIKKKILTRLFKVSDNDVFPAYHKLNSLHKIKMLEDYSVKKYMYISDLNYTRKWVFIIFLIWHIMTKIKILQKFRTNILVVLEKK